MSSSESRVWAAIAWALLIIGAIVALIIRPRDDYVRYWAVESIGFTIVIIIAWILVEIVSIVFAFTIVIPLILKVLYGLGVFLAWIIGVFKALTGDYWRPPIIHETSEWVKRVLRL
ncbi:DUF4870 domain-containing protein [Vulcanisaeta distributa]|uniref:Uncharacterized protein n=1 Tax=Vulcanisaeta distributa (strain DSM 14429 / JCM 11212 / NBRC 100878 / IC-017) TaxID=572478 RepID=E1QS15_VULDI|nr:DUF4870 domain-containing protein [Vulcanisaeta distributa]ADN50732.1 conserved hypothetical protein [Vulcanisaeta distributa DSM 14429]